MPWSQDELDERQVACCLCGDVVAEATPVDPMMVAILANRGAPESPQFFYAHFACVSHAFTPQARESLLRDPGQTMH